jgi:hypothetical protein
MQLLRELSRLQDDQAGLREETRDIHKQWRSKVGNQVAKAETKRSSADRSEQIRRSLEPINDARLGRDARRGLADAEAMLDELDQLAGNEHTTQLELAEAAQRLESALQRTLEGAESKEREGKAARRALERAQGLANDLSRPLPSPDNVLEPSEKEALHRDETRQSGLFQRLDELASGKLAGELPAPGKRALENAKREMGTSAKKLGEPDPQSALEHQQRAWKALQDAIDSLRQGSPPPPAAAQGDASTEADRDRSLRDSLMDAMREGAPSGFDESVKRYYEELLQ